MNRHAPTNRATKRAANAFRHAAKAVEDGQWCSCCNAINFSTDSTSFAERMNEAFKNYFKPDGAGLWWWGGCACRMTSTRGPRVLALCFMAAMVEAGDA
jgi:hypothetical protein